MTYQVSVARQDFSIVNIRAATAARSVLSDCLQTGYSQQLPVTTGIAAHSELAQIICISPDHWLLVSENMENEQQRTSLMNLALDAYHANATLVTDQYACFKIEGSDVREVLCQGCSINLDPDVFHFGHAAACGFTRSKIILIPQKSENQYLILIESSLADYFEEWIDSSSGKKLNL